MIRKVISWVFFRVTWELGNAGKMGGNEKGLIEVKSMKNCRR